MSSRPSDILVIKGGDVSILCSLASFDVYMANASFFAHKRPPKTSMLVLKTTESLRIFENAEEAMHMLCFSSPEQRDAAFLLLQKRRVRMNLSFAFFLSHEY